MARIAPSQGAELSSKLNDLTKTIKGNMEELRLEEGDEPNCEREIRKRELVLRCIRTPDSNLSRLLELFEEKPEPQEP